MQRSASCERVSRRGDVTLEGVGLSCETSFKDDDESADDVETFFLAGTGNSTTAAGVVDGFNLEAPDYRANADVADAVESTHLTGWFDTVDYIGAVGPDSDWTAGWTSHAMN